MNKVGAGLFLAWILMGLTVLNSHSLSKPIDAKKTKKSCLFCHTKYGSKELTEAGKYYKEKRTLDGFPENADSRKEK
jgi:hypothetical protein